MWVLVCSTGFQFFLFFLHFCLPKRKKKTWSWLHFSFMILILKRDKSQFYCSAHYLGSWWSEFSTGGHKLPHVWVISLWQLQRSLMAAAVTEACITHLSKLLRPPPFRWESTPRSHHTCTYVHTDTLAGLSCTRAQSTLFTDTFPLWWQILPELAPICESRRRAVRRGVRVKLPCHLPFPDGSEGFQGALSGGHDRRTANIQFSDDSVGTHREKKNGFLSFGGQE